MFRPWTNFGGLGRDVNGGVIAYRETTQDIYRIESNGALTQIPMSPTLDDYRDDRSLYFFNEVIVRGLSGTLYMVGATINEPVILYAHR